MSSRITTDRLTMIPHGLVDFDDMMAMWGDERVVTFLGGQPFNEEDSWARLQRHAGTWALFDYGIWAVRRRDTGAYVGAVGYLEARRTGVKGFDGDPEIGWTLNVAAQGHGFAVESVQAALAWGAGRFRRTVAMIDPGNTASIAVAKRCGFAHFADSAYKNQPTMLWEHRWPAAS